MGRSRLRHLVDGQLISPVEGGHTVAPIAIESAAWFTWLDDPQTRSFAVPTPHGTITLRREQLRSGQYWYAYRKHGGALHKRYVGKSAHLTQERLDHTAAALAGGLPAAAPPSVSLRILGTPRLQRHDHSNAALPAKALAVLGYLALQSAPQRREHILDVFWPGSMPSAAHKNLRNTLWRLRAALGPGLLHADGQLALDPSLAVDAWAFQQLAARVAALLAAEGTPQWTRLLSLARRARALVRGPLLDGIQVADAPEFELWLTGAQEVLHQQVQRLVHAEARAHQALGQWDALRHVVEPALASDPLQETLAQLGMEAHARMGDRAAALRVYTALRDALQRELGVAPLPETDALRAAIATGELAASRGSSIPLPMRRHRAERQPQPAQPPLIGRNAASAQLDAALAQALVGQAHIAVVSGELGIGKTRLWQAWSATLDVSALDVLELRGLEANQAIPFAPLAALLPCHDDHTSGFAQARAHAVRATLAALVTAPNQPLSPLALATPHTVEEERQRRLAALSAAIAPRPERPLVVLLDDAHWLDPSTRDWLATLVARMRHAPLLLVLAYRPEDAPPPLIRLIAGWSRDRLVTHIPLARLAQRESITLLTALGRNAEHAALYQQSAGNPLFLVELAQSPPGAMPHALDDLVRARLHHLPPPTQQVVQTAAVLHPVIEAGLLRQVSGRTEDEVLDALDALLHIGVLAEQDGGYQFSHPLVARIVTAHLSMARRQGLHRRALAARKATAGDRAALGTILAAHALEAGEPGEAAHFAERAGERALAMGAAAEAMESYRQAVSLEPTPARQLGLGQALMWQGRLADSRAAFAAAREQAYAMGESSGVAAAYLHLAGLALLTGQPDETVKLARQAQEVITDTVAPALRIRAAYTLAAGLQASGQSQAEAERLLLQALQLAQEVPLPLLLAPGAFELGNVRAQRGDFSGAQQAFRDAIGYAQAAGDRVLEVIAANNAAYHALLAGDLRGADATIARACNLAEAYGIGVLDHWLASTRGEVALAQGQWETAEHWFRRAMHAAQNVGNLAHAAQVQAQLGLVARAQGALDVAVLLLEQAREAAASLVAPVVHISIALWQAETYAARGERVAARAALGQARAWLAGRDYSRLHAWFSTTQARIEGSTLDI